MTSARKRALSALADGPITEIQLTLLRIQRRVMMALVDAGHARWHPYGHPSPNWKITSDGRSAVKEL